MDRVMGGGDESADMRDVVVVVMVVVGGDKKKELFSGRVESQAWPWHTALPVFIPSTRLWLLTSFKTTNSPEPTRSLSFSR